MAGVQTRDISVTFGLRPWAEMPTSTWKAHPPGASLPPSELLSSQRLALALPLGDGLRLGVPPEDFDGDLLLACEKVQLSPLRHLPFLKKWHIGRPLGDGVLARPLEPALGEELRPLPDVEAAATGFLCLHSHPGLSQVPLSRSR